MSVRGAGAVARDAGPWVAFMGWPRAAPGGWVARGLGAAGPADFWGKVRRMAMAAPASLKGVRSRVSIVDLLVRGAQGSTTSGGDAGR